MADPTETIAGSPEGNPQPAQGAPAGQQVNMVEKSRLDNAMVKIQELTLANRTLSDQLVAANSRSGELQAEVTRKASEVDAKTNEHTTANTAAQTQITSLQTQLALSAAKDRKIKAIAAADKPELYAILDVIPVAETDEAQAEIIKNLGDFATKIRSTREAELLAGVTDTVVQQQAAGEPKTEAEWTALIDKLPFGSIERNSAWEKYFAFTQK